MASGMGFGHAWQQHDFSDVDIVLSYEAPAPLHLQQGQVLYRSITSIPEYAGKSFEELRLEHWHTSNLSTAGALVQQGAGSLPGPSRPADSTSLEPAVPSGPARPPTATQPNPSFAPKHADDVFLGVKVYCLPQGVEPAVNGTAYAAAACAEAVWAPGPTAAAEQDGSTVLRTLPAHKIILSNSPYLLAQMMRWQLVLDTDAPSIADSHSSSSRAAGAAEGAHAGPSAQDAGHISNGGNSTNSGSKHTGTSSSRPVPARPQVHLTLQNPDQEQAALAVLSALYLVKPLPELLSELPQHQLLHAAVLADMWQVPAVPEAAVQLLCAAAVDSGLTPALVDQFCAMPRHPRCLLPLLRDVASACLQWASPNQPSTLTDVLLSLLGDLDEVWADEELRKALRALPLEAMALLLGSDRLQVSCEDNVLYTAQAYVGGFPQLAQQAAAQARLARMVRCQHLSMCWLSATVLSPDANQLLLGSLIPEVKLLLALRQARRGCAVDAELVKEHIQQAPFAWRQQRLGRTQPTSLLDSGVQVRWAVDVAVIKQMAQDCVKERCSIPRSSPATPPLAGCDWAMQLVCEYVKRRGARVSLYSRLRNIPAGLFVEDTYELSCSALGQSFIQSSGTACRSHARSRDGLFDCFDLGVMAGGWNQEAWGSKGLPAAGQLDFTLKIKSVGHWP